MHHRATVTLTTDTHRYLSGVAHEQSLKTGKRVSISTVIAGICDVAVEAMRERDAAAARGGEQRG